MEINMPEQIEKLKIELQKAVNERNAAWFKLKIYGVAFLSIILLLVYLVSAYGAKEQDPKYGFKEMCADNVHELVLPVGINK
jgi:hypothetical protein